MKKEKNPYKNIEKVPNITQDNPDRTLHLKFKTRCAIV